MTEVLYFVFGHIFCDLCRGWRVACFFPYNVLIFAIICTMRLPRTWSTDIGMFIWPFLPASKHQWCIIMSNMYSNSWNDHSVSWKPPHIWSIWNLTDSIHTSMLWYLLALDFYTFTTLNIITSCVPIWHSAWDECYYLCHKMIKYSYDHLKHETTSHYAILISFFALSSIKSD